MKNSWRIYTTDLKKISTNWVAALIIGGLIILPSLYAWFNIKATWDPYSQTDQIPVGVVNEDQGGAVRGETFNAGDELIKTLKKNNAFDWKFTNRKHAMDKVKFGDYYAVIVIPKDFSKNLSTVIDDHPKKATVEYYVNEKINAISPKITSKGASTIVEQISSNFISTVNGVIFDIFNKLGIELQKGLPDIKKFENYIFTAEKKLPEVKKVLDETYGNAQDADKILNKAQGMIPEAKQDIQQGLTTIDNTTKFLNDGEKRLDELAPQVKADLQTVQKVTKDVDSFIGDIQSLDLNWDKGEKLSDDIDKKVTNAIEKIGSIESALKQLQKQNNADASPAVTEIRKQIEARLQRLANELNEKNPGSDNQQAINQAMDELRGQLDRLNTSADSQENRQKNSKRAWTAGSVKTRTAKCAGQFCTNKTICQR
ncbi:YhgE/Pip domain-containing protein [Virgibacillus sp. 179-BFC.A HS]|uniref:YhgE/Pip domain-containing protein n=1 Tax=Tigheibacillus jepli TaxID=3035914 RepID=A0ABU5CJ23_9BACI|nr:YhgE/Pip domain-containing protein [Virgibacillus sp. 179-BFC.A HS]MDY0406357.1 YhgE/Pip domain-containing protein [Virgibacillus sp. 179-BFC.A HS]